MMGKRPVLPRRFRAEFRCAASACPESDRRVAETAGDTTDSAVADTSACTAYSSCTYCACTYWGRAEFPSPSLSALSVDPRQTAVPQRPASPPYPAIRVRCSAWPYWLSVLPEAAAPATDDREATAHSSAFPAAE